MTSDRSLAKVVPLPLKAKPNRRDESRKSGMNLNKEGSVRKINSKVYVDFMYLGERVRECSGLVWNDKNAKLTRDQLDKIIVAIKSGTFRFSEVFPSSKNVEHFSKKEKEARNLTATPNDVYFKDYALKWYDLKKEAGRVTGRTLREYKSYLIHYLIPFFGDKRMADLNAYLLEEFVAWARKLKIKGLSVSHKSIKKYLVPMRMICESASIEYQWRDYNPFFGFKQLKGPMETTGSNTKNEIFPFSVDEISRLRQELPDHWKPYFDFAFSAGLRPGEQIAIKPSDIDWVERFLFVCRAVTLDESGKRILGATKNEYSRRKIELTPVMLESLQTQKRIHDKYDCEFFFCTENGCGIHLSNLRRKVWIPALKKAAIPIRALKQTRHTFATLALSSGEDPLWISRLMGHSNVQMIINHYTKYVKKVKGVEEGAVLNQLFENIKASSKEQ